MLSSKDRRVRTRRSLDYGSRYVRGVVVGAGIGGLAAAIALEQAGVEPTVIERAPELQEAGFGLVVSANAVTALRSLGLRDGVAARGTRRPASAPPRTGGCCSRVRTRCSPTWSSAPAGSARPCGGLCLGRSRCATAGNAPWGRG